MPFEKGGDYVRLLEESNIEKRLRNAGKKCL